MANSPDVSLPDAHPRNIQFLSKDIRNGGWKGNSTSRGAARERDETSGGREATCAPFFCLGNTVLLDFHSAEAIKSTRSYMGFSHDGGKEEIDEVIDRS
jgi:hypothetical protein